MTRFLTPPAIAKILGVAPEQVVEFIARGELRAVNTSLCTRPRWKVSPEDFDRFIALRSNQPQKPKRTTKRVVAKATKSYV